MKRILMILTSHRLDCLRLAMDLLVQSNSLRRFDRVVMLLNGVTSRHLEAVRDMIRAVPDVRWDLISGPRGRGERISSLQNECVHRYPGCLYFKIDEDTFVSRDWVDQLTETYEAHCGDPNLALITPVVPNNAAGSHYLLTRFPSLGSEYSRRFQQPLTYQCDGPVWKFPQIADWITRQFLDLQAANNAVRKDNAEPFIRFAYRFSINCIVYHYQHWQEIGGVPEDDEVGWAEWIRTHGKYNVLATNCLVHHYSFFVQQHWLDRTGLLEDLRAANLPPPSGRVGPARYYAPRLLRIARQVPETLVRRMSPAVLA